METLSGNPTKFLGTLNDVEVKHAPEMLFVCGRAELMRKRPRVSIIGSRTASKKALDDASEIACIVTSYGGVAVSGLAKGVDAAAHRGAIECGGDTIAVIGTPLDQFYPRENAKLQEQICQVGVVVTQFSANYPVNKKNFVMRNRTMALLSHASVIVEAGESSGTQHQGWEALRLGRLLFMPESLLDVSFDWPRKMRDYGAIFYRDVDDLKDFLMDLLPPAQFSPLKSQESAGIAT